jgi:hypothetical protein
MERLMQEAGTEGATGGTPAKPKKEKSPVEKVKMSDGREVDFVGKRKLLKESIIDESGRAVAVRLDFRNGNSIVFKCPDSLLLKAAGHGLEQKLGDETAGEEDVDDMQLAVEGLIEHLEKGEWTTRQPGDGMSGTSVLLKALVELTGKTAEQVKAFLKDKKQAEKIALRNSPKVKPIVERIENEKLAKAAKVDTDALLGALDAA